MSRHTVNQISQVATSGGKDDCAEEINEDNEPHAKAAEATEVFQPDQFSQVVNCRVDPASSLRKKDTPRVWCRCASESIGYKLIGHLWEMFGHECCKESIFSKREEILFVQRVHVAGIVIIDDLVRDDQWPPFVSRSKSIHAEARIMSVNLLRQEV